jgi:molybdopterin-guanine dinucleotide biosynthesis protein A
MGRDKALLTIEPGGVPVISRVLAAVAQVADDVFIVAPDRAGYSDLGVPIVPDLRPGYGPLGGLETALRTAGHDHCLVVSCDLPFLDPNLLAWLAVRPRRYDVLLPMVPVPDEPDGAVRPQPLLAIYTRSCLPAIEDLLAEGDLKLTRLVERIDAERVGPDELRRHDPELRSFFNMNSPADARIAAAWLAEEGGKPAGKNPAGTGTLGAAKDLSAS